MDEKSAMVITETKNLNEKSLENIDVRSISSRIPDTKNDLRSAHYPVMVTNPSESKTHIPITHTFYENDLEAQSFSIQPNQSLESKTGLLESKVAYDPMWPNRRDLKLKRKALKRERACCSCWASMSRKQRHIITTVIIIVVLGAGLSVGFGISKRVGGGVVNKNGPNSPVSLR